MNVRMKKFLPVLSLVCAFAAQADDVVVSENIFGLMAVDSGTANTIVATPWLSATGEGSVLVSNLVKTTNLSEGDKLYVINGNGASASYDGWQISGGNWAPIGKYQVAANGTVSSVGGASASDRAIVRGQGVWLVRSDASKPFYLYGEYSASSATTEITEAGTQNAPKWYLVGNASTSAFEFNAAGKFSGTINAKDTIVIPTSAAPLVLTYTNNVWTGQAVSNYTDSVLGTIDVYYSVTTNSVPAGTGFWYVSRGGTPTITW